MATASYYSAGKRRLMGLGASKTAGTYVSTTPTDTRGMKDISFQWDVTAVTGGSDALDGKIQGSHDKITWIDLGISFTQATAATNQTLNPTDDTPIPRWIRGNYVVATGATASWKQWITYRRRGDGSMAPTKAAQTTAAGALT